MDKEKKDMVWLSMAASIVLTIILITHWLAVYELITFKNSFQVNLLFKVLAKLDQGNNIYVFRLINIGLITIASIFQKYRQQNKTVKVSLYISPLIIGLYVYGYSSHLEYALYAYPIIFIFTLFIVPIAVSAFITEKESDDQKPLGINKKKGDAPLAIPTKDNGDLIVPNVNSGGLTEGEAGTGKTQSVVVPYLLKFIDDGRAGVMYDYEGDVTIGGGYLSKIVYTALKNKKKSRFILFSKKKSKVKFAFINLTDMSRTARVNPIAKEYIKSFNHALEIASAIVLNLNPELALPDKKFWADNAIYGVAGAIYHFVTKRPHMATLAHVVEFLANDYKLALYILSKDPDVVPYIRPVLAPILEKNAGGQAAGASSTTQFSVVKLRSKEAYYVLSPAQGTEMDLDITNKKKPVILCLGGSKPEIGVVPVLGSILQICRMNMNLPGKHKAFFMVDELPSMYIKDLHKLLAEVRKHGVATLLALQTFTQLVNSYGEKLAKIIYDNCGTQYVGRTSLESAERLSKMAGEYKKQELTNSYSDGSNSTSVRTTFEKVLRVNDITTQPDGHFSGKVAGGKPTYFSTQLKGVKYKTEDIPAFNTEFISNGKVLHESEINQRVEENYQSIINQVQEYMDSFIEPKTTKKGA